MGAAGARRGRRGAASPARSLLWRWRAAGPLKQLVAIFGTGDLAERLVDRALAASCPETIELVGVFDDRTARRIASPGLRELPHGTTAELVELSRHCDIDRIARRPAAFGRAAPLEILRKLRQMPVEISLAPDMVGYQPGGRGPTRTSAACRCSKSTGSP